MIVHRDFSNATIRQGIDIPQIINNKALTLKTIANRFAFNPIIFFLSYNTFMPGGGKQAV